eukprot:398807_1
MGLTFSSKSNLNVMNATYGHSSFKIVEIVSTIKEKIIGHLGNPIIYYMRLFGHEDNVFLIKNSNSTQKCPYVYYCQQAMHKESVRNIKENNYCICQQNCTFIDEMHEQKLLKPKKILKNTYKDCIGPIRWIIWYFKSSLIFFGVSRRDKNMVLNSCGLAIAGCEENPWLKMPL